jgi:hypothetical protein
VNTAFMMGGALGLAVLAAIATSRTDSLLALGDSQAEALAGGYHAAFMVGALFAAAAGVLAATLLRPVAAPGHAMTEPATAQAE